MLIPDNALSEKNTLSAMTQAQERQDWLESLALELRRARERCLRDTVVD